MEGNDYIIPADGKDDDRVWKYQEEELDIADLQDALENLNAEYADSFTDEMPSGKEEISLTVYLDNETYPTMEITLYRYDGSDCLAAVDGQPLPSNPFSRVRAAKKRPIMDRFENHD